MTIVEVRDCPRCFDDTVYCVVLDGHYYPFPRLADAHEAAEQVNSAVSREEFVRFFEYCDGCKSAHERMQKQERAIGREANGVH
jgi:hypothetical protein